MMRPGEKLVLLVLTGVVWIGLGLFLWEMISLLLHTDALFDKLDAALESRNAQLDAVSGAEKAPASDDSP